MIEYVAFNGSTGSLGNREVPQSRMVPGDLPARTRERRGHTEGDGTALRSVNAVNVSGAQSRGIPELDIPDLPGALCPHVDKPDIFHPSNDQALGVIAKAKAVCSGCPVKAKCLEWCQDWERRNGEIQGGIWGGTTEWERRELTTGIRHLCRSGRHEMVGHNAIISDKGFRCRACLNEAGAKAKRERRAKEREAKIGA